MEIRPDAISLKCACHNLPFAYLQDGYLLIVSRHHGEKCHNIVPLVNLSELRLKEAAPHEQDSVQPH